MLARQVAPKRNNFPNASQALAYPAPAKSRDTCITSERNAVGNKEIVDFYQKNGTMTQKSSRRGVILANLCKRFLQAFE